MTRAKHRPSKRDAEKPAADPAFRLRLIALAGLTALLIASPLIPSESPAEMGTGCVQILAAVALVAVSLIACAVLGKLTLRIDGTDVAVVALMIAVALSAWWMAGQGNPRATINAAWQWGSMGLLYLLVRQLLRTETETRALCVVMVALATALSALGAYQVFVTIPQTVARYRADPESVLREAGIEAAAGSPERKLFEDRLESTQPTATFALTNSLAAFIVPWLIVAVGIAGQLSRERPVRTASLAATVACCLALGFCVLLTKSRTAMLAGGLGLAVLGWWHVRGARSLNWRLIVLILASLALLVAGVAVAGVFDWLVLSEAPKSLLYRLEYWQSTFEMIADHPWLGCGPGNFQQYYSLYKLPEASETVADPHNFVMEIWATTGTLGVAIFVVFAAGVFWRGVPQAAFRMAEAASGEPANQPKSLGPQAGLHDRQSFATCWAIGGGALAGSLAAFPLSAVVGFPLASALLWLGIPVGVGAAWLLMPWATCGRLPGSVLMFAMIALLLNLSAAGGIGFAGVATSFWSLAAVIVNGSSAGRRCVRIDRPGRVALAGLAGGLLVLCYQTMYAPVLTSQAKISAAMNWGTQGRLDQAESLLRQAAVADSVAAQPWIQLAAVYHARLLAAPSPELQARFDEAVAQAKSRNKRSFSLCRQVGDWRLALYRRSKDRRQLEGALEAYQRWSELYPNSNLARAQLAWTYHLLGDNDRATEQAALALRLDAATPHKERKLGEQQIYEVDVSGLPAANAEQLMQKLRNASST